MHKLHHKLTAALAWIALSACGSPNDPNPTIEVLDDHFSPDRITVPAGTAVSWAWNGEHEHNVVFPDEQSEIQIDGGFAKAFPTPGTYRYQCTIHLMSGTITVR